MSTMNESTVTYSEFAQTKEPIYFCEQHGPMNKFTDLKEKADQISKQV
jgi:hypothetical protein